MSEPETSLQQGYLMDHSMTRPTQRLPWQAAVAAGLLLADGLTFLFFSSLHAGAHPFGIAEPPILPALIVESACCVLTLGAGIAIFTRRTWALRAAVWAQSFAAAGVVLGIVSQFRSGGTTLNFVYHRVILTVLVLGLIYVLIPSVRRSL
jgi:hypothetical protein